MEVQFSPDQEAFIHRAIESGRYRTAEEAVRDAMARWEEDERSRFALLTAFDEAESDLAAGDFVDYNAEELPRLADDLKNKARALRRQL